MINKKMHVLEREICNLYSLELEEERAIPDYLDNKLQKANDSSHLNPAKEKPQQRLTALTGRAKISEIFNTEDEL